MKPIGIIGAGAWGSALAKHVTRLGRSVHVWHKEEAVVQPLKDSAVCYSRSAEHLAACDIILCVVPAQAVRTVMTELKATIAGKTIVICSKGIENSSNMLVSQVINEIEPSIKLAVLSGPNFAKEMMDGKPAGFCLAAQTLSAAQELVDTLKTETFFGVPSIDIIGAQLGGSLKNVIAIGCGMTIGAQLGDNAKAALITLGLAEIKCLGLAMGADEATFSGLSGLGDLVLTCNGPLSRNLSFGINLGKGMTAQDAMAEQKQTTEGYYTAQSAVSLAKQHQVHVPVIQAIHQLLQGEQTLEQTFNNFFKS